MRERMTERERWYREICRAEMRNPKCARCGRTVSFDEFEAIRNHAGKTIVYDRKCFKEALNGG